jgi:hypothetical protein
MNMTITRLSFIIYQPSFKNIKEKERERDVWPQRLAPGQRYANRIAD